MKGNDARKNLKATKTSGLLINLLLVDVLAILEGTMQIFWRTYSQRGTYLPCYKVLRTPCSVFVLLYTTDGVTVMGICRAVQSWLA